MLLLDFLDAANASSDDDAYSVWVFLGDVQAAVGDGTDGAGDGVLGEAVHAFGLAFVDVLRYVKMLYLAAEMDGEGTGIERFDVGDPTSPFAQRSKQLIDGLG